MEGPPVLPHTHTDPKSTKRPRHWRVLTLGTMQICPRVLLLPYGVANSKFSITLCFRWSWVQIYAKVTSRKCNMKLDQGSGFFIYFSSFCSGKRLPARSIMVFLEKSLILGSSVTVRRMKCLLHYADWVVYTDMKLHVLSQKDVQDYFLTGN